MIRLLIFLLWIVFFAALLTLLFTLKSEVSAEAFGWRFDVPLGVLLGALAGFSALLIGATALIKDALKAPGSSRARRAARRRETGLAALAKGFEALSAGDPAGARKAADAAGKALGEAAVVRLLAAEAAPNGAAFAGLLNAPETEFLALKGAYERARRDGDPAAARRLAERAFALHPAARWAFDAVFDLALAGDDFAALRAALERAEKSGTIDAATAARTDAAALAAIAFAEHEKGEDAAALAAAENALRRQRDFAPAAALAATLLARRGEARKAEKMLAEAFAAAPGRVIAEAYEGHLTDDAPLRADKLDRLAEKNAASDEAALLRARAHLLRGEAAAAARLLEERLTASAQQRALALMAEAQRAQGRDDAARAFLERAASAPREGTTGLDDLFRLTPAGWRRLIRDTKESGRWQAETLERAPPGLPAEAFFLKPPPAPDPAEAAPAAPQDDPDTDEILERGAAAARGVS